VTVEVKNLGKKFGSVVAIVDVSFEVEDGIFVLIGPNGAGKTTTLRCLSGEIAPDMGEIKVFGKKVEEVKEKIAVLREDRRVFSNMKVKDYEELYSLIYPKWNPILFRRLVLHFNIPGDQPVEKFSAGMKTLFLLSLVISSGAELLLLDEPTQGLDPMKKEEVMKILREAGEERVLIVASHHLEEIEMLADNFAIINEGKVVYRDNLDNAKEKHRIIQASELTEEDEIIGVLEDGMLVKTERDVGRYSRFREIVLSYIERSLKHFSILD